MNLFQVGRILIFISIVLGCLQANGQLMVSTAMTPTQLVQNVLLGSGVTVSDITYVGDAAAIGYFYNGNTTNLGLKEGIILSTGNVINARGPNLANGKTTDFGRPGDPLLTTLAGRQTYDAAILEFDFTPQSDTIKFRYVFGSEEYPEFVNSFNDIFGFFISGPRPGGGFYSNKNIALIPNTSTVVSVNNVNNGPSNSGPCTFCYYYSNNTGGLTIEYDGFTRVLTAWCLVLPCYTYHIKIAIADAVDGRADTGVFLEKGSFSSGAISTKVTYTNPAITLNNAIEGCKNAQVTFTLPSPRPYATVLPLIIGGTAKNGVDYMRIPDSVVFGSGKRTATIDIIPMNDSLNESPETVTLKYNILHCDPTVFDSLTITIQNKNLFSATLPRDHAVCMDHFDTLAITASGGWTPYTYIWSVTFLNIPKLIFQPSSTAQYGVGVMDMCNESKHDTITVTVNPRPEASILVNDTTQCLNENLFIFLSRSTISEGSFLSYWDFGDGNASTNEAISHIYTTFDTFTLHYTAVSDEGCKDSLKRTMIVFPSPDADFLVNDDNQCLKGNNFVFTNNSSVPVGSLSYNWTFGDLSTSTQAHPVHQYANHDSFNVQVLAVSSLGCQDSFSAWMKVPPSPNASFTVNDTSQCLTANNFVFNNTTTIPKGLLNYNWYFGDGGNSNQRNPSHTYNKDGKYQVWFEAVSAFGCSDTFISSVVVFPMPEARFTHSMPCLDDTTYFNSTSFVSGVATINAWDWDFGNSDQSSTENPLTVYSAPGNYTVSLRVTTSDGCSDDVTSPVRVMDKVPANQIKRVSVSGLNDIIIEWEDVATGMPRRYHLERSLNGINYSPAGIFGNGVLQYTEKMMYVNEFSYYYRMAVTDSCGFTSSYSNIGKTIHLVLKDTSLYPVLVWNNYRDWPAGVMEYVVEAKNISTGKYEEVARLPGDTIFEDRINPADRGYFYYRIKALSYDGLESYSNSVYLDNPFTLWIPNSFTPNGDGLNDRLLVKAKNIKDFQLEIFDRWGGLLFETTDPEDGWDGSANGMECHPGTYHYRMLARGSNGRPEIKTGFVHLIR